MTNKAIYLTFSVAAISFATLANAAELELCGNMVQGGLVKGQAKNLQSVTQNGKTIPITNDGNFLLAFDRDAKSPQELVLKYQDGQEEKYHLNIAPTKWDIQRVNGVAQSKVTPAKSDNKEIEREGTSVNKAISQDLSKTPYWEQGFIEPLEKYRVSGEFGNQRIFNGIPKSPHRGTDMAAASGTPIKASADGIVKLSGGNFFYSGNMVIIDHGQGLHTMYAHMDTTSVKEGDKVKQGDIIGTVGKTGRATGPHLHWGATYNGTRFNPKNLLDINKNGLCKKVSTNK